MVDVDKGGADCPYCHKGFRIFYFTNCPHCGKKLPPEMALKDKQTSTTPSAPKKKPDYPEKKRGR